MAANNRPHINQILENKYLLQTKENDYGKIVHHVWHSRFSENDQGN